jgi:hypothetical protein
MTVALCRSNSSIASKLDASSRTDLGSGTTASGLPAGAAGRVYLAPAFPFGWIDEPPSVNRLLGLSLVGSYALAGRLPGVSAGRSPGFLPSVLPDRTR